MATLAVRQILHTAAGLVLKCKFMQISIGETTTESTLFSENLRVRQWNSEVFVTDESILTEQLRSGVVSSDLYADETPFNFPEAYK